MLGYIEWILLTHTLILTHLIFSIIENNINTKPSINTHLNAFHVEILMNSKNLKYKML